LHLGDHGDQRSDGGSHRVRDQRGCLQLLAAQRGLDLDRAFVDAALAATAA
jgi:hypothetical protein